MNHAAIHPATLTSLVIVRDRSEFAPRSAIRGAGLLTVRHTLDGPRFALAKYAFDRGQDRADVIAQLRAAIDPDATVLHPHLRLPSAHRLRHALVNNTMPTFDVHMLQAQGRGRRICQVEVSQAALRACAETYGLPQAERSASLAERVDNAANEATAVWLTFLWSLCRDHDRVTLTTAWQAWSAIERARRLSI